jgi:hypothetical protein
MNYRLTNREFSRVWRRSKKYSDHEIKWLARKRGLLVRDSKDVLTVYDKDTGKTVASFEPIEDEKDANDKRR